MAGAGGQSDRRALALMAGLFALFGCVTWLNGVLIPFLKIVCQLDTFEALLVTFAFYIAYFVMALPSARVLNATGYRRGMALGLAVMAAGTLVFLPAALLRSYGLFLAGLFTQGTGLCLLQTAANPYVIILGPAESAARRVSIMGVCNKLAGALSPMALGALVFAGYRPHRPGRPWPGFCRGARRPGSSADYAVRRDGCRVAGAGGRRGTVRTA